MKVEEKSKGYLQEDEPGQQWRERRRTTRWVLWKSKNLHRFNHGGSSKGYKSSRSERERSDPIPRRTKSLEEKEGKKLSTQPLLKKLFILIFKKIEEKKMKFCEDGMQLPDLEE